MDSHTKGFVDTHKTQWMPNTHNVVTQSHRLDSHVCNLDLHVQRVGATHSRMGVQATDMDAHANQWAVTHKAMGIHTHLLGIQTQAHGDPQV